MDDENDNVILKKRKLENNNDNNKEQSSNSSSSNINDNDKEQILINKIFNNIVLFKLIFKHVGKFKKNECKNFSNKKELKEYSDKEYISKLIYNGKEMLEYGDLPMNGSLKELVFTKSELSSIQGKSLPYGLEIIQYRPSLYSRKETTPFITLPSTIHTINNAVIIIKPSSNNNSNYIIPPNIKSISFFKCPNISNNNENFNGFIKLPETIRSLKFSNWNNEGITLGKGDIPFGLVSLKLGAYKIDNNINITKDILPNSIKELDISCVTIDEKNGNGFFDFLPENIETLLLNLNFNSTLTINSNLNKFKTIKKLSITFSSTTTTTTNNIIEINSLPNNIIDLKINNISNDIEINTIPNNVLNLELWLISTKNKIKQGSLPSTLKSLSINKIIEQINILPESLTHLELISGIEYGSKESLINMISILPKQLNSIILPKQFKEYHNDIIKTINNSCNNIKYL